MTTRKKKLKTTLRLKQRAQLPFSDLGNAQRLTRLHGDDIRYCWPLGKWLVWDAGHWRLDHGDQIIGKAKATVRAMYREAAEASHTEERRERAKWATASESRGKLSAMIHLAQSEPGIPVEIDELDANSWLLGLPNGVIDLKTGKLGPPRRDDLLTRQAPVEYDRHAKCPIWLDFLDHIFSGNKKLLTFLQRAAGYALTGDTSEQCLFVLWGAGANGKSTFLNTLRALLGDYAAQADMATFMVHERSGGSASPDVARLRGARFVVAMEAEDRQRLAEALIKQVTGGDMLAARHLYAEQFQFVPAFKIFMGTNHKPAIKGTDYAIWRRLRLIPFKVTIPPDEQDRRLPDKLIKELPGILNWAVEGCLAWQRDGLQTPTAVTQATRAYQREQDLLGQFIDECCVSGQSKSETLALLYQKYIDWCKASNTRADSKNQLVQLLEERGLSLRKGHANVRLIDGLQLRVEGQHKRRFQVVVGGKK